VAGVAVSFKVIPGERTRDLTDEDKRVLRQNTFLHVVGKARGPIIRRKIQEDIEDDFEELIRQKIEKAKKLREKIVEKINKDLNKET
jgi:hypothetical protein